MITKEVDYAIRALLYLSQYSSSENRLSAAMIAENMDIPYRFLRNIIRMLIEDGFIDSRRGNGGGLCLLREPQTFTLYDVIRAVNPKSCLINNCLEDPCPREKICPVHKRLKRLQNLVNTELKAANFAQLIADTPENKA